MAESPEHRFGINLRAHRKRLGLTQEALGFKTGLHPTEIGRLERGEREARLGTMVKLARGLDIRAAELLDGI